MGTRWSARIVAPEARAAELRAGIGALLGRVVSEMSQWEPSSDLSRFNRAAAGSWHTLPPWLFEVVETAVEVARDSEGAFDPTIGALADRWGFGPAAFSGDFPDQDELHALRAGWQQLALDQPARRALQPGGATLDLSGIAKGFAVDRMGEYLRSRGLEHFLVEIGGEYVGAGIRPDGQPWWVDVEQPPACDLLPVRIALHGLAAATSGDYRRYHAGEGARLAHTIDPRTGRPIDNGVASVTMLHPSCMMADALATVITVLGPEQGVAFAAERDLAAYIIVRGKGGWSELMSPAFASMLD